MKRVKNIAIEKINFNVWVQFKYLVSREMDGPVQHL
jgi:hypothetical protein